MQVSVLLDYYDRSWTLDDLADLPDDLDWRRVEIVDGMLVVSPPPDRLHASVVDRLHAAFVRAVSQDGQVTQSLPVRVGNSYRVGDLTVIAAESLARDSAYLEPSEIVLVVEVESPSSVTTDRITKPAQYALGGIPHFWRVEREPLRLVTYALRDGAYVETGSHGADDVATITEPFAVTIDVGALAP